MFVILLSPFFWSSLMIIISSLALAIAYFYMERYLSLEPCPLCILDRFALGGVILGNLVLMAAWFLRSRLGAWLGWIVGSASLAAGFLFAGRHVWLQNQEADESAFCLSENEAVESWIQLIEKAFDAKADCATVSWQLWGLAIPTQVLLLLLVLALMQLILGKRLMQR